MIALALVAVLAALPRQAAEEEIRRLIEGLGAPAAADRDRVAGRLKSIGKPAAPLLRASSRSTDPEIAARSAAVLRWIDVDAALPASVKRAVPDAVDRLAGPGDAEGSRVLATALAVRYRVPVPEHGLGEPEHLILRDRLLGEGDGNPPLADLAPLAARALREARLLQEKALHARLAGVAGASDAIPELRRLLDAPDATLRAEAAGALGRLRSAADTDALIRLLRDPDATVRHQSLLGLRLLAAKAACPRVAPLLSDRDPAVRMEALRFALDVGKDEMLTDLVTMIDDPVIGVVLQSREAWEPLGGRSLLPKLKALQSSEQAAVARAAAKVIKLLEAPAPAVQADPLRWQAPKSVGALTWRSSTPRDDAGSFEALSASTLVQGISVEHVYTAPEGTQVSLLFFRHTAEQEPPHDFDGIWHRVIRERPKAVLTLEQRAGQRLLAWTGAGPASAVAGGLAWRAPGGVTVLIQSSAAPDDNCRRLADEALTVCPSTLPKDFEVRPVHEFVVDEVDKCLQRAKQEDLRREACMHLTTWTYFIAEGMTVETTDAAPLILDQFPRWWEGAKKSGQEQWLKERLARETARLRAVRRSDYPFAASRVALSLESLAGTRFPPGTITSPEDLSALQNHWERFTKAALASPRPRWAAEEIDVWISWLESPAARAKHPSETSSSMLTLQRVLQSVDAPAELLALPRINLSRDVPKFVEDLDQYLVRLKTWWKERRSTAAAGPADVPPLFEEGGTPRITRD